MTSSGIDHSSGFCNSIGGCISETDRLDTPVMLGTNKNSRRPTRSWNSSSFLIHLIVSAPPSTSAEDKTHFAFLLQQLPYLLLSLSQRLFVNAFRPLSAKLWVGWVHVRCLLLGYPDYHSAMVARIECSCARLRLKKVAHCPEPLPIHLPCLAVYVHSMDGMPILIHESRYVPYSQAKVGGTVRQLCSISYKRRVYYSTQNRSAQMAGIDVKETYRVSRAVPKSDESVARGMLNQGMWEDRRMALRNLGLELWIWQRRVVED